MQHFKILSLLGLLMILGSAEAQVNARMFQYPDVSETQITFNYAGNIWVAPKTGGLAVQLSSPIGSEMFPKFSPDGSNIAFTGNYGSNYNVYTIPTTGGLPKQLTHHGSTDRVVDWHPNGKKILFASSRKSGRLRFNQFYYASLNGGLSEKLPLEHAEYGSISPNGTEIAFTDKSRLHRTWKRYRGGTAADIWLYNTQTKQAENITNNPANDELPMYYKNTIFYLSDQGKAKRFNIWKYEKETKKHKQVTFFKDFDIHFPSIGPSDLVFEAGGKLYLLNLNNEHYNEVKIQVTTDLSSLMPSTKKVSSYIHTGHISPDGKRVALEARGDIFSLPAEKGAILNLTQSSGSYERTPAWSPDGKYVAYWSDASGEYQLVLRDMETGKTKAITQYKNGYRYDLHWSPDNKKLAFIDQTMTIYYIDIETQKVQKVDQGLWMMHYNLARFSVSWSPDSRYITYSRGIENQHNAIFVYDTKEKELNQVTSGYYSDYSPAFDPEGKYLFYLTDRNFSPTYSDMDNSWIYHKSTRIAALPLTLDIESPLAEVNDTVKITAKKDEPEKDEKKDDKDKKSKKDDKKEEKEKKDKGTKIDFTDMESRVVLLPPKANNYSSLSATKGKVIYILRGESRNIQYYDLKSQKTNKIVDADGYAIASNGKKMLAVKRDSWAVIDIRTGAKMDKKVPTSGLMANVTPKEEWKQIFKEVWRIERDFFYDKKLHGVKWDALYQQYSALIEHCTTRSDLNYLIGELIAELNASHAYRGGGESPRSARMNVGYLGINWEEANNFYRIKEIIKGAPWDAEAVSPLAVSGIKVKEGDYIFSVNGVSLTLDKEPEAAFVNLANKTVELKVGSNPNPLKAKSVIVKLMSSESRLRHLQWIEQKRKRVAEATDNKVGYIYVRSTGIDGQNELVRQFYAQWDKEALIIDERFNSGGQIPDRFIELLNRKPLAYFATRDGKDWPTPSAAHYGPKVMLINGWSGSGGDAFPDYFKKAGLGELIGTRTWGGLIGISGAPNLIDNGMVTAPTFRMFSPDNGEWFPEGHGVEPDIEVAEDPGKLAQGIDPQLEKAIEVIKEKLKTNPYKKPKHEKYEKR